MAVEIQELEVVPRDDAPSTPQAAAAPARPAPGAAALEIERTVALLQARDARLIAD